MNIDDFHYPGDHCLYRDEIYLDDSPVDHLLYFDKLKVPPTPADIVRFWTEGFFLSGDQKRALIAILVNMVNINLSRSKIMEAENLIMENLKVEHYNQAECIRLLIALVRLKETYDHSEARKYYLRTQDLFSQNECSLDDKVKQSWYQLNKDGRFEVNPFILRSKAFSLMEMQRYMEAEDIYRQLIDMNFELPGTLCHLARVQFLSAQDKSAEESVEKAWQNRENAKKYVVPRIIFLKILYAMICNNDPVFWIKKMKEQLNGPDVCMEWQIAPLLESRATMLGEEDYVFIYALAEALQSGSHIARLEYFKKWTIN